MTNFSAKNPRALSDGRDAPSTTRRAQKVDLTYRTGHYKMPEMPTLNPFGHAQRILQVEQTIDLLQSELESSARIITDLTLRHDRVRVENRDLSEALRNDSEIRHDVEHKLVHFDNLFRALAHNLSLDPEEKEIPALVATAVSELVEKQRSQASDQHRLEEAFCKTEFPTFVAQTHLGKLDHLLDRLALLELENADLREADMAHRSVTKDLDQRKSQRKSITFAQKLKSSELPPLPPAP